MSKESSAKYYQNNLEILQRKACERYQNLSKKEKEKNNNMVIKDRKFFKNMKSESLLSIENKIIK